MSFSLESLYWNQHRRRNLFTADRFLFFLIWLLHTVVEAVIRSFQPRGLLSVPNTHGCGKRSEQMSLTLAQ